VEDWMKGKIIESQSSDTLDEIQGSEIARLVKSTESSGDQGLLSAGFLDVFVDTMGEFTEKLDKSNKASEDIYKLINQNIVQSNKTSEKESVLLESVVNNLRELNVNQFSNASMMEESLQEISNVILSEHKSVKKNLSLQEENNMLLKELISKIEKLESNNK